MRSDIEPIQRRGQGLVDVLDRVLDKGLVIAGDIRVSLAEVELITIRIRLLVCSIDKAEQIGLDWWRHDPYLSGGARSTGSLPAEGEASEASEASKPPAFGEAPRAGRKRGSKKTAAANKSPNKSKKKSKKKAGKATKARKPQGDSSAR